MCTGRVDLAHVLRAFSNGADGVFLAGCRMNECNYTTHGNLHALSMVSLGKRLLESAGLNPDRLRMELISSGEGNRFAEVMNEFGALVRRLGPLGLAEGMERAALTAKLQHLSGLVPYLKIEEREKLSSKLTTSAAYGELYSREEIERLLAEVPSYSIDAEKCRACGRCAKRCPAGAITGAKNVPHSIDRARCIRCGKCLETCPSRFGAVRKVRGEPLSPEVPGDERDPTPKRHEAA